MQPGNRKGIIGSYVPARLQEMKIGQSGQEQLEEVLDILFRRKWLIIGIFIVVAGAAAVYTFNQTPTYRAQSLIMVDLGRTSLTKETSGLSVGENLFATNERSLYGELFVIQSSTRIAEAVRERLKGPQNGYVRFDPASSSVNAISVSGISSDPSQAALLANLYAEEYVNLTKDASRTHMTSSREFLEAQEQQRRKELREAEDRVKNYIEQNGAVTLEEGGARVMEEIASLQSQLDEAKIELGSREGTLATLEDELATLSPQLADRIASRLDLKIEAVQSKLAELEVAREEILLHNPDKTESELGNTRLPQINRQIAQLKGEIESLSEQYVQEVIQTGGIASGQEGLSYVADLKRRAVQERIAINGLTARIDAMQQRLAQRRRELSSLPQQAVDLARLERAKQQSEDAYAFVAEQLRSMRIEEETEPGYAHILRKAREPLEPVGPDHRRNLILGCFFGLMLGLGTALIRDKLDTRIYKPLSLREDGFEVLGVIPDMSTIRRKEFSKADYIERNGRQVSTSLIASLLPISAIAEAYRHIRTRIQFSLPDRVIKTLLITSSGIGEGKSTTAANLAVVMAQANRRTLLIDADLRRPQLRTMFGAEDNPTLLHLLSRTPDFDAESMRTDVENLYLICASDVAGENASGVYWAEAGRISEILGSARMRELLEILKERFDVIVIDTPPLMAATDATLLSTQCDATILVTKAGHTKEPEVQDAHETLVNVGANVLGVILNRFDVSLGTGKRYRYDYYSKYGIYSQYGNYNAAASTSTSDKLKRKFSIRHSG